MEEYEEAMGPTGQIYKFPKGTPDSEMKEFIDSKYSSQSGMAESQGKPMQDLIAMSPGLQENKRPPTGKGKSPLSYEESPEEANKYQNQLKGNLTAAELMASFLLPGSKAATMAGRAGMNALGQGGIAAAFNPKSALETGGTVAGATAVSQPLIEALLSNNKYARATKRAILPILGATGAAYGASEGGLGGIGQSLAAAGGAYSAPKMMGYLAKALKINDKFHHMRPHAEQLSHLTEEQYLPNFLKGKEHGVTLSPGESSQLPSVLGLEGKLGRTPEGADILQKVGKGRQELKESLIKSAAKKAYDPETMGFARDVSTKRMKAHEVTSEQADKIYKPQRKTTDIYGNKVPVIKQTSGNEKLKSKEINSLEMPQGGIGHYPKTEKITIPGGSRSNSAYIKDFDKRIAKNIDIQDAMGIVRKRNKFAGMSNDEFSKSSDALNETKKLLQSRAKNLSERAQQPRSGSSVESEVLEANMAANEISSFMRKHVPGAEESLRLNQKKIGSNKLIKLIENETVPGKRKTFIQALSDPKIRKDIDNTLVNAPEAKKQVDELYDIFKNMKDIKSDQLAKSLSPSLTHGNITSAEELASSFLKKLRGGEYDSAAIKFSYSPEWPKLLKEMKKQTTKEKATAKFIETLSRQGAHLGAKNADTQE